MFFFLCLSLSLLRSFEQKGSWSGPGFGPDVAVSIGFERQRSNLLFDSAVPGFWKTGSSCSSWARNGSGSSSFLLQFGSSPWVQPMGCSLSLCCSISIYIYRHSPSLALSSPPLVFGFLCKCSSQCPCTRMSCRGFATSRMRAST